jgi:hypothetical protein
MPLPVVDQLILLHRWSPLLGYLRRLSTTIDARDRAEVIAEMLEWLAEKTGSRLDDRLAARVAAVLRTPEGVELVREAVAIVDTISDSLPQEPAS